MDGGKYIRGRGRVRIFILARGFSFERTKQNGMVRGKEEEGEGTGTWFVPWLEATVSYSRSGAMTFSACLLSPSVVPFPFSSPLHLPFNTTSITVPNLSTASSEI